MSVWSGRMVHMPRSIWKGAISFGLVTIPVKLFSATEEKDISFRQVHPEDGGRIKYKRVCEKCGKEIPYTEIAKGYELPDGRMVILEAEDFEALPLATTKAVEVVQFVAEDEVDPTYFNKTYFLQADGPGVKPYVLLRDALTQERAERGGQGGAAVAGGAGPDPAEGRRAADAHHAVAGRAARRVVRRPAGGRQGLRRRGDHGPVVHQRAGR